MKAPHIRRRALAIRFICGVLSTPAVIGFAVYHLTLRLGLAYKPFLVLCGIVFDWPINLSLAARYSGWRRACRARALGAVTASESPWKTFTGVDVLWELREISRNGFIGEFIRLGRKLAHRIVEHHTSVR